MGRASWLALAGLHYHGSFHSRAIQSLQLAELSNGCIAQPIAHRRRWLQCATGITMTDGVATPRAVATRGHCKLKGTHTKLIIVKRTYRGALLRRGGLEGKGGQLARKRTPQVVATQRREQRAWSVRACMVSVSLPSLVCLDCPCAWGKETNLCWAWNGTGPGVH